MTTVYEAVQERPNYWDGARVERQHLSARAGDWRMSHTRIARTFTQFCDAERYARRILGQRPGVPVEIYEQEPMTGGRRSYDHVATVSRDALGRTWTDALTMEGLI